MVRILLSLSLMAGTPALAAPEEAKFENVGQTFADAETCRVRLATLVKDARRQDYVAAEGPYSVAADDDRAHMIRAEAGGHRITEYRCQSGALSSRSWTHEMAKGEEPFTIDSVARDADWLKHPSEKQ